MSLSSSDSSSAFGSAPLPEVSRAATIALVLEIVFGLFGILGVGHAYSGRLLVAVGLLVGWWLYILVAAAISAVGLGIPACLALPIYIAVPIVSGLYARSSVLRTQTTGSWGSVAAVAGAGCLVVIVVVVLVLLGLLGLAGWLTNLRYIQ